MKRYPLHQTVFCLIELLSVLEYCITLLTNTTHTYIYIYKYIDTYIHTYIRIHITVDSISENWWTQSHLSVDSTGINKSRSICEYMQIKISRYKYIYLLLYIIYLLLCIYIYWNYLFNKSNLKLNTLNLIPRSDKKVLLSL